jgi:hypothetical protein
MQSERLLAYYDSQPLVRILNQEISVHTSSNIYLRSI